MHFEETLRLILNQEKNCIFMEILEILTYHQKPASIKDAYQHKTWQKKLTIALSCYY